MKLIKKIIVAVGIGSVFMLTGCASGGNVQINESDNYSKLEAGVSNKAAVFNVMGQPADVLPTDDGTKWVYVQVDAVMNPVAFVPFIGLLAGGVNQDWTVVTVFFDEKSVFDDIRVHTDEFYESMWVGVTNGYKEEAVIENVRKEFEALNLPFDEKFAKGVSSYADYVSPD